MAEPVFKGTTEFAFIKGKASWIYVKQPSDFGDWRITLHISPEEMTKVLDLQAKGVKNQLKKDDDGYYIRFRRPVELEIKDRVTGLPRKIAMRPPEVITINEKGEPELFDGWIGNGSDVEVKLEVYEHKTPSGGKARAARLLGIRVDNLVPFEQKDWQDKSYRAVKGLAELEDRPKPKW